MPAAPPARRGYGYGSGSAVVDGTAGVPVRACQGSCAPLPVLLDRYGKPGDGTALRRLPRRVGGTAMARVAPWWTVRPACRYGRVRVPARRRPPSDRYDRTGDGTGEQMFCPRAHCSPENRSRRLSARHSAVKTAEGACERSEVLTARQCRALQSHAVFRRNAPQKS
jgi:hypothetical protein